jgi:hypothetical protein
LPPPWRSSRSCRPQEVGDRRRWSPLSLTIWSKEEEKPRKEGAREGVENQLLHLVEKLNNTPLMVVNA